MKGMTCESWHNDAWSKAVRKTDKIVRGLYRFWYKVERIRGYYYSDRSDNGGRTVKIGRS